MLRILTAWFALAMALPASAQDAATLEITWPPSGATLPLPRQQDADRAIGVVVRSNYTLKPAGTCGGELRCGHVHMRIDPDVTDCNLSPDKPYNSMNSDYGGELIKARFGLCKVSTGKHVIGVQLADDHHQPVLIDGKPVIALVPVTTTEAP